MMMMRRHGSGLSSTRVFLTMITAMISQVSHSSRALVVPAFVFVAFLSAQEPKVVPVFEEGEAQVVAAWKQRSEWIQQFLWVETTFDSDGDGKPDRMHVDVYRQKQTDTDGLKVPVVYETSPYFAGVGSTNPSYFWDPKHELGAEPPPRQPMPAIAYGTKAGMIPIPMGSDSDPRTWVPRGYAVVHSSSPGTGFSQGCPTVGGDNESLAPKAVIDWLCGRAKGYTTPDGNEEVKVHVVFGQGRHDRHFVRRHAAAGRRDDGRARTRSDHPDRAEHLLLPLLQVQRPGPASGRLHG
jgi:X-Pro dipeptidyl-peptidase